MQSTWMLASHWATGETVPTAFLVIMLVGTYALILALGFGIYRLLRQTPSEDRRRGDPR